MPVVKVNTSSSYTDKAKAYKKQAEDKIRTRLNLDDDTDLTGLWVGVAIGGSLIFILIIYGLYRCIRRSQEKTNVERGLQL